MNSMSGGSKNLTGGTVPDGKIFFTKSQENRKFICTRCGQFPQMEERGIIHQEELFDIPRQLELFEQNWGCDHCRYMAPSSDPRFTERTIMYPETV